MEQEIKKERIEFRGGLWGLMLSFVCLFGGIIWLSVGGKAMPMAFWVPTLAALACALIMSKDPKKCSDAIIEGMSNNMVAIMLMAWFLAGIVAQIMKSTGLVEGLIWLATSIGLDGRLFPVITFVCGALLSTATGTSLGTVMSLAPIMYPVGVAMGANPAILLGAIVSAGYFGDNIAPVSDTTIASAYTQGIEVSEVVRSRLKYAFVAAALACVFFYIFGSTGTGGEPDLSFVGDIAPKGLIMLVVPALLIFLMIRGAHLIVALMGSIGIGLVLGLITGLLKFGDILIVDMDSFSVGGIIVDGINSLVDIAIFAFFLMGLVNLLERSGFFDVVLEKMHNYTQTARRAELMVALVNIVLCALTVANSVVIVMEGPIAKRLLVEKHRITRDRSANLLDAVSAGVMCLLPYAFGPLLAYMFASASGAPVDFSVNKVALCSFHGWGLLLVMFVSIMTGWGRTYQKDETPEA